MEKMSPDELKRRQDYLKEQREKLLKMKQQDREKQLSSALKSNPARPQSARTARAAMANQGERNTIAKESHSRNCSLIIKSRCVGLLVN